MGDALDVELLDEAVGVESDYLEMLPLARAVTGTPRQYAGFAATLHQNVKEGVAAVLQHEARFPRELPTLDLTTVRRLPRLSSALGFAARRVDRVARRQWTGEELRVKQAAVLEHRRVLLLGAEALAAGGLLPAEEVARIKKGRGFYRPRQRLRGPCGAVQRACGHRAEACAFCVGPRATSRHRGE